MTEDFFLRRHGLQQNERLWWYIARHLSFMLDAIADNWRCTYKPVSGMLTYTDKDGCWEVWECKCGRKKREAVL